MQKPFGFIPTALQFVSWCYIRASRARIPLTLLRTVGVAYAWGFRVEAARVYKVQGLTES